ncbi:MAG TPA: hypothetical protein VGL99_16990 [Chloroflexota bacterium]|jgi:hypothetical protein
MAVAVGPLIFPPGQYTHCVDRTDYKNVPGFWDAGFATIAEFTLCEYLLGGKLVCLAGGRDECAIGVVVGVEEVGYQKTFPDSIDNDLSFNLLVLPYGPGDFTNYRANLATPATFDPHKIRDDIVNNSPLGNLLTDPQPSPTALPTPREPGGTSPVDGYGVLHTWNGTTLVSDHENQNNLHKLWDEHPRDGSVIGIPILHVECEGSRIYFVCAALKPLLDIMQGQPPGSPLPSPGEVCHALLDWVPFGIGRAVCALIEHFVNAVIGLALAPALAAAFASAWEAAQVYDDLFVTGPIAKQIHVGDHIVVSGRWTWDAGHAGHTELHPVKTIQRLRLAPDLAGGHDPRQPLPPDVTNRVRQLSDRWCQFIQEAPPPPDPFNFPAPGRLSGPQLAALTPEQHATYVNQQRPEHGWTVHPSIDGCLEGRPKGLE